MQTIKMRLQDMKKPDRNIRMHTEMQLQEYERSVRMFGQIRPIVVDESGTILAGAGLYDTLVKMGREDADVYQLEGLSDGQKKKLMIADNKIFSLGVDNIAVLNEFIDEMKDDLDIPGFDEEILKQMVSDADEVTKKIAEYGTLDEAEIDNIRENAARQEQKEALTEQQPGASAGPGAPLAPGTDGPDETADIRKFVICPNCGEKIWL